VVGRPVPRPPPHRSRRAVVPHRALQVDALPQSRLGPPSGQSWRRTPDDARALDPAPAVVPQGPNPGPRITPPLTAALEPFAQATRRPVEDSHRLAAFPLNAIVVVVPAQLGFNPLNTSTPCAGAVVLHAGGGTAHHAAGLGCLRGGQPDPLAACPYLLSGCQRRWNVAAPHPSGGSIGVETTLAKRPERRLLLLRLLAVEIKRLHHRRVGEAE
jgi:hypothetical protein